MTVVSLVSVPQGGSKGEELAGLLDQVDAYLGRYVAFPSDEARWATAAWVAHTHAIQAFESTPRLALLSAEKGSGKTRTLEVIEQVVVNAMHTVNVSAAALFRKVSEGPCVMLLDEADTYLGYKVAQQHEDLRGLVNAGHRRGAVAYRCVIDKGVQVQEFPAFAPVAIAGIGDLPDTILDRSIVIAMKRRKADEHVEPYRWKKVAEVAQPLNDWLVDWAKRSIDDLEDMEPEMPDGIVDRPADVWEPLVILGDFAGDPWATRIRSAAVVLNNLRAQRDPSLGVQLLADTRAIFDRLDVDRMSTDDLLAHLVALDESPWGNLRGQEIDARGLARRLRPYEVRPGQHRFGEITKKGYLRPDFHDAWQRYLPAPFSPPGEAKQGKQPEPEAFDTAAYEDDYADLFDEEAIHGS